MVCRLTLGPVVVRVGSSSIIDSCRQSNIRARRLSSVVQFLGLVTAALLWLLSEASLGATDTHWLPTGRSSWSSSASWDNGVPTSVTRAWIETGGTATVAGTSAVCSILYLGYHGPGTIEMNGGSFNSSTAYIGGVDIGAFSAGTFIQSGGTSTMGSLSIGYENGGNRSRGVYVLSGTAQLLSSGESIGYNGAGTLTQSGGTNVGSPDIGYADLILGNGGGTGTYILEGGAVSGFDHQYVGYRSIGIFCAERRSQQCSWACTRLRCQRRWDLRTKRHSPVITVWRRRNRRLGGRALHSDRRHAIRQRGAWREYHGKWNLRFEWRNSESHNAHQRLGHGHL